jgi:hypothetical protein
MSGNVNQSNERGLKRPQLFKRLPLLLLAIFAFTPAVVLAQQNNASQAQNQSDQQPQAAPAKPEETQKQPDDAQSKTDEDSKLKSVPGGKALGMSILGNQEAPKALVIVPWKSSEMGNGPSVSTKLDDSRLPVDKDVFMRMLSYYEIRSEAAHPVAAPANGNTAAPANAAQRRK